MAAELDKLFDRCSELVSQKIIDVNDYAQTVNQATLQAEERMDRLEASLNDFKIQTS